jgi:hypothetical protein
MAGNTTRSLIKGGLTMKQKILFRAQRVDNRELVCGDVIHGVGPKHGKMFILPISHIYPKDCHSLDGYEVIPETVERLVHEENGIEYFTGDKLAVYSEYYPTFEEAFADGEACVSEIDDNGLVILENEEAIEQISMLSYCHKFYHISQEEFEKYLPKVEEVVE